MNYLTEINLFYDWLETHRLSPKSIALWHGLMFIANRSGWKTRLVIPISTIESRTSIARASIYREREHLRSAGLIDFDVQGSKLSSLYTIYSLEECIVSRNVSQNVSQNVSHSRTQHGAQTVLVSPNTSQIATHSETIYKLNETERHKSNRNSTMDTEVVLAEIEPAWQDIMRTWLEYKRVRRESYKNEIGIRKCIDLLKTLSGGNSDTAAMVVDQSMANNWAGLFELKRSSYTARGHPIAATGQRIGQIIQPENEEKAKRIIEKFNRKK